MKKEEIKIVLTEEQKKKFLEGIDSKFVKTSTKERLTVVELDPELEFFDDTFIGCNQGCNEGCIK